MKHIATMIAAGLCLFALPAAAQDTENVVIFGQYYRCNQGAESQIDAVVRQTFGPIVQRQVDAGRLTGWVWLAHSQGGPWRRLLATTGSDLAAMMDARQAIVDELNSGHADFVRQLGTTCSSHDDYIWNSIATSPPDPAAIGGATLSTYYACDASREGRTNEIFREVLAPLYEKHRNMGHVATWGFYAHRSGGIFRRLETFSGADHKTLLNMQTAIAQEANANNPLAMNEFREICSWHTDYMWNNITSG